MYVGFECQNQWLSLCCGSLLPVFVSVSVTFLFMFVQINFSSV